MIASSTGWQKARSNGPIDRPYSTMFSGRTPRVPTTYSYTAVANTASIDRRASKGE